MTATEYVILVDKKNNEIGISEKIAAHQKGLLHRAFSVFLFRKEAHGITCLLQQRAADKYHSSNLWTNACCSHPQIGETVLEAGKRRVMEELGIVVTLKEVGCFQYFASVDHGLSEHELDHVLVGWLTEKVVLVPNPREVQALRWVICAELEQNIVAHPEQFTPWFSQAFQMTLKSLQQKPIT